MKNSKKAIANKRIEVLFKNAVSNSRSNPELAQRQAKIIRKLSMKFRIKMPWELRASFCKKCKKFIAPGINSRVRLGRGKIKSIRITCCFCEHTYRKVLT